MSERNDFHYDAFISYRHNEFDSFVAENLHKKLENFKLPKSVLTKVKDGKKKIERVFRDVDELPLTDNLSDPISKALLNSDYLITICTPRYPESRWCMKEIEVFLQTHPRDHILVVLAEDEPTNSFPEILCYEDVKTTTENGEIVITRRELEPLAADTRGTTKKEVLKAMDIAVIKLCAAMFGLNYDDLKQRHREQRIRRLAAILGGIGAAVLAFAVFATVMLIKISIQNVTINEQYQELQDSFASSMAAAAGNLMKAGRKKDAVYAARSVISENEEDDYNAAALKELYDAMGVYKVSQGYEPVCAYDAGSMLYGFAVSADQKYVLVAEGTAAYVCDAETGLTLHSIVSPNGWINAAFCGDDGVLWNNGDDSYYYSFSSKESTQVQVPADSMFTPVKESRIVLVEDLDNNVIYAVDNSGSIAFTFDYSDIFGEDIVTLGDAFCNENEITCCFSNFDTFYLVKIDASNGEMLDLYRGESITNPLVSVLGNMMYLASSRYSNEILMTDIMAVDSDGKKELWKITLEDFELQYGTFLKDDKYLYTCGKNEIAIIDNKNGELIQRYFAAEQPVELWLSVEGLEYVSTGGRIYFCNEFNQGELTDVFFKTVPNQKVTNAKYVDGNLYLVFGSESYVTRYSDTVSDLATIYGSELDYGDLQSCLPEEVFADSEKFDVNLKLVDNVFYSDDKKYILTLFSNHTAKIYDAESGQCVNSFDTDEEMFYGFEYSDVTGSYIIRGEKGYIFDKSMRLVCETSQVFSREGKDLILSGYSDDYSVPYIDRTALCKMADEYLGDYEPSNAIKQKYGLR
ncbi:toll/interleukin-1 receptor domain-containing protein [Butyrivibrio sp. MC2021]|uniref:toll/interleukin-1 receptor domain-containing protein n=1 Tax=Butyrivibrio sp. MC2021 TaxID=1408306 RepID=UPI000479D289|nr:toll/interleukin-1 receptor domain-containing protein [Butyrivibrio sp. MC2021]